MILGRDELKARIADGSIHVEGVKDEHIGPCSIDVHLGNMLYVYNISPYVPIDPINPPELIPVPPQNGAWRLDPGVLYLGHTKEWTSTVGLVPDCNGRSSIGRLGVRIHATAGWGDPCFRGHWTLEIDCVQRVLLRPGMRVGQLRYTRLDGDGQYKGRYQDSSGVVPSRYGVQQDMFGDDK